MPETAVATDKQAKAEENPEQKFPKLDGILMPLVAANANVLVKASWMGAGPVTLTDAAKSFPYKMSEENADQVIATIYELLANPVTEEAVPAEASGPEPVEKAGAQTEPIKEPKKGAAANGQDKNAPETKTKIKEFPEKKKPVKTEKAEPKPAEIKKPVAQIEHLEIKPRVKKKETEGPEETGEPEQEEEEVLILEKEPEPEIEEIQHMQITIEEPLDGFIEEETVVIDEPVMGDAPEEAIGALTIDELTDEIAALEEPITDIIEILEEEDAQPQQEPDEVMLTPVYQEAVEVDNDSLTIEEVEAAIYKLVEGGEFEDLREIDESLEQTDGELSAGSIPEGETEDELEQEVVELLSAADISPDSQLVGSLKYLAANHDLIERIQVARAEGSPDAIEEGIGTHEIIRSLLAGPSVSAAPQVNFYSIGGSALVPNITVQIT